MAGGEMDLTMIIVCAAVGSLGLLSAILGFSAEGTKLTLADIVRIGDACVYPQSPALALGVCASIFLIMAQATVAAVGGCCGSCGKKPATPPSETKRIAAVVCAVFSWITAAAAFVMLMDGAGWNANVVRHTYPLCYFLRDGIFAGAAVLTLVATALGLTSYVLLRGKPSGADADAPKMGEPEQQTAGAGIAMAQPQQQAPPAHGYGAHAANQQFPPQGYGVHTPNQHVTPQGYGAHAANQQFPPQGYRAHAPNVQVPLQGYGAHAPNVQLPPQGYEAHVPNQQFPPQGYGAHTSNQQVTPQGYVAQEPNMQFPPAAAAQGYEPHAQVPPPPNGHEQV